MVNEDKLKDLLGDLESDNVERTVSETNGDKFRQAICAFSNDLSNRRQPGYLLIGVRDDGRLSGLKVTDKLLKDLSDIRSDGNILPQPSMNVGKYSLQDGDVAVVQVFPSDLPPVRYKGRIYIRVGPRRAIANEQEERILAERRVAKARSFDAHYCPETAIDDLSLVQFSAYRAASVDAEIIAQNHRSIEDQLASLRLYDHTRGNLTYAGILMFGKNPRFFLPGAYIQYLKLPGSHLTDVPDDQAEISGDIVTIIREMEARIKLEIKTTIQLRDGFRETQLFTYPEWALRELVINSIMHRNYDSNTPIRFYVFSDRIEIQNPGGLYGEATRENFPSRNSYRNPIIAEAMKSLGFVNRFGYGVQRTQKLLENNGNPPAQFEFDEHSVLVKIFRRTA